MRIASLSRMENQLRSLLSKLVMALMQKNVEVYADNKKTWYCELALFCPTVFIQMLNDMYLNPKNGASQQKLFSAEVSSCQCTGKRLVQWTIQKSSGWYLEGWGHCVHQEIYKNLVISGEHSGFPGNTFYISLCMGIKSQAI